MKDTARADLVGRRPSWDATWALSLEAVEDAFLSRRTLLPDLPGAFGIAFASTLLPGEPGHPRLWRAGMAVAEAIERLGGSEPAYHNRHHFAEATLAMGWLCRMARFEGLLDAAEAGLGVVAMVGHDMHHDGSAPSGGLLEQRALAGVRPVAAAAGLGDRDLEGIADVILATNPTHVPANAEALRAAPNDAGALLRVLANEADVTASMLPMLGPRLTEMLAEEWRRLGREDLLRVGPHLSRLQFLQSYPAFSSPARRLGLDRARHRCVAVYAAAGGGEAEAGAVRLDRMAPPASALAYAQALAATSRPS